MGNKLKSRNAIERVKHLSRNNNTLLIVVPRNVLKVNWTQEINK